VDIGFDLCDIERQKSHRAHEDVLMIDTGGHANRAIKNLPKYV
jgi:hypothetical protein